MVTVPVFAVALVLAADPLSIVHPLIHDLEDGSVIPSGFSFVPGQFVYLSFEIAGYKPSPERKLRIKCTVDAMDPRGVKLMETLPCDVDATLADEDKNWKPKIRQQLLIPPLAGSGTFKLAIAVKDEIGGQDAAAELRFQVRGRDVPPSDTPVVRNFHFYRSEEDPNPLATAAYRPGDTVWARFDITGYKLGPGNAINVEYGIAVLAPSGKVLFSQPQAAVENSSSFYPKPYIPGSLNLNLQSSIHPGQYTIAVTVQDRTGNQSTELRENFTIE
jgi:hypothetical protein